VRTFPCMTVSTLAACAVFGQAPDASPRFEVADVHPSRVTAVQVARGPFMSGARYDLRNATLVDLIVKAYDVTPDKVVEGPSWLEYDRFDISATVPPRASTADAKLMLQALLTDRFNLAIRKEARSLPAYVLTAPKGKQKLKEADGSGDTGCRVSLDQPRPADPSAGVPRPPTVSYTCRNMTMAAFAAQMTSMVLAQQFIGNNPVQDKTGLEGMWEFNFKYTLPLLNAGSGDAITLPDALDKQVGLKLEQETISLPVIVVEKVNRTSPNEPDVAKKIPASPTEFEVATIKPFAPPGAGTGPIAIGIRMQPGGRVEISGLTLKQLMQQAWSIQADSIVDAPKWMDTDRYAIVAKMPGNGAPAAPNSPVDIDTVYFMLRALLADRFKLAVHFEDRPLTAYTLTAPKPKLKKADPATRTKWNNSNSPIFFNGSSAPSTTIKFQNMSMAQLAEKLQFVAGTYIHAPVINATGLEGGYDFTLTFSPIAPAQLANLTFRPPDAPGAAGGAADPIGGVSIFEAVEKQLGLKLVEQKRPVPVLVIDHIEQQPTEN
jgi:uncharacterized protein (TIGR03435 family)